MAFSMKEKEIRIASGIIYGSKHKISIEDIRRVQCVTNGSPRVPVPTRPRIC